MRSLALAVAGLVAVAACEPVFEVKGNAQTMPACPAPGADPYAGSAAADANVVLRCPKEREQRLGKVDKDGRFRSQMVGAVSMQCALAVEKDGYFPMTFSLTDVCLVTHGDRCHLVSFSVDLFPRTPPTLSAAEDMRQRHEAR